MPINFTIVHNAKTNDEADDTGDIAEIGVTGWLHFVAQLPEGMPALAPEVGDDGTSYWIHTFKGYLDTDGVLKNEPGGTAGVRIWANDPAFNLEEPGLPYLVYAPNGLRANGKRVEFKAFVFYAPSIDVTFKLSELSPVPSATAEGISHSLLIAQYAAPEEFTAVEAMLGVSTAQRCPVARTLTQARMRTDSAPVGSALTVEVQHFGGAVWETLGTLSIADGSLVESVVSFEQFQKVGDLLRLNTTSVGSSSAATGVIVEVLFAAADAPGVAGLGFIPEDTANKGQPGGYAGLDGSGKYSADGLVDGATNKVYTATEKSKLGGVASGATANQTDAYLLSRANHTGTQSSSTISDFTEAAQDAIAALLAGVSGVTLSYNDAGNTLTVTGPGSSSALAEDIRDAIGIALIGSGLITVAVNDGADTITISTTATANDTDANLKNRANHTGTQLASTISNFATTVDAEIPVAINAATAKSTPVDADKFGIWDSVTNALKSVSFSDLKVALGSLLDPITTGEETLARGWATSSYVASSGELRLRYFTARKTEPITKLALFSTTAAGTSPSGPTLIRAGIFSVAENGDLTLVASIPNDVTLLAAAGAVYQRDLSASWNKVAGTRYAYGYIVVTAGAVPGVPANLPQSALASIAPIRGGFKTGLSDLPSTVMAATISASSGAIYAEMRP